MNSIGLYDSVKRAASGSHKMYMISVFSEIREFNMRTRIILILVSNLLGACQSQGGAEAADDSAARGELVYSQHCATCHGDTGTGNEPWLPSLQRLAALREPADMVGTVMTGRFHRAGEINSHTIPIMPAWGQLSDADVAAIINYVQQNWGEGTSITAAQVQAIRTELWETE